MPYLPEVGNVSWDFIRADRAAQEYDERLRFRVHPENGQYTIFIRQPDGKPDYPILGFAYEIPHPDHVKKELYRTDTIRHGEEMLDKLNAHNDAIRFQNEVSFRGVANESAMRIEHALRKGGMINSGHVSVRKTGSK